MAVGLRFCVPPIKKTGAGRSAPTQAARANRLETPTRQGTPAGQEQSAAAGGNAMGGGMINAILAHGRDSRAGAARSAVRNDTSAQLACAVAALLLPSRRPWPCCCATAPNPWGKEPQIPLRLLILCSSASSSSSSSVVRTQQKIPLGAIAISRVRLHLPWRMTVSARCRCAASSNTPHHATAVTDRRPPCLSWPCPMPSSRANSL